MRTTLNNLKVGQECQIISVNIKDKERKRHLLDLGVTRGTKLKVKRIAPMGDPVSIEIRDYTLSIGKEDLKQIIVEK